MLNSFLIYLICGIVFILLFLAERFENARNSRTLFDILSTGGKLSLLFNKLFFGIIVTGAATAFWFISGGDMRLLTNAIPLDGRLLILILLSATAMITGFVAAKKLIANSLISADGPSTYFTATYILFRTLFLIGYEFFFRGVLLFSIIFDAGEEIAIAINILLYALLHCFSNRKELIGTIPFGLLLCIVTLFYQSIWPAVIIHLCLAIVHEIMLLSNNRSSIKTVPL